MSNITAWSFTAAWMLVIFLLSAQPAEQSGNLSMGFTQVIVRLVSLVVPVSAETVKNQEWLEVMDGIIRECAHGAAYFILALLFANALKKHSAKKIKLVLLTLAFCAAYAISDEIHQWFVPGRACELFDFEVDMLGAVLSITILLLISFFTKRLKHQGEQDIMTPDNKN